MKALSLPTFANNGPADLEAAPRRSRLAWIPGVLLVLLLAVPIAWLAWQVTIADNLLGGLGAVRGAVRAAYTSAQGYGADGSAPRFDATLAPGLQTQWQDLGGGMLIGPSGLRLQVTSRLRTFEVEAAGLSPLACRLVLQALESGWSEVRVNGVPAAVPTPGLLAGSACGWVGGAAISLTSAG